MPPSLMLWLIPVASRLPDPLGDFAHAVPIEASSWAEAALSIANHPDWAVVWEPPPDPLNTHPTDHPH